MFDPVHIRALLERVRAEEREALRTENKRLREALGAIVKHGEIVCPTRETKFAAIAREALGKESEG